MKVVGITNDFTRRAGEHLRNVGREIEKMRGLPELTKNQARGIEQVLIEKYGLGKLGGQLENKVE